jgi:hypothetical protein
VLLPYEATEYIALASGVFAEAAALGKVIVYPAETWMAEQVACGHATGIDFAVASSQEIGAALLRALASLKEMSSVAQARSNAFRAQHSCGRNLDLMLMLAAAGHDMSLPYLPGTSVRFDKPVQSRGYLGRGWSSFEPDGIWTNGPVAELVFCLAHGPTGSLDARLLLTPFFSKGRPQRITISIGEAELGKWSFPVDGEYIASWCRVTVPEHCVANGSLRMRLHVEDPHSPNQVGISNDPRALGVMLHEMRFEPIEAFSDGVASKPSIQPLAPRVSLTESDTPRPARLVSEDFYLRTTNDQTAARLEHLEAEYQRMMSARSVQFGIRIRLIVERLRRLLAP